MLKLLPVVVTSTVLVTKTVLAVPGNGGNPNNGNNGVSENSGTNGNAGGGSPNTTSTNSTTETTTSSPTAEIPIEHDDGDGESAFDMERNGTPFIDTGDLPDLLGWTDDDLMQSNEGF